MTRDSEEQFVELIISDFKTYLQSGSNEDSMVPVEG